jgi:general secretion pathway protein L
MADANGIACLPLAGSLARAMLPAVAAEGTRWSAPPAVAAAAERWLGAPVNLRGPGEQLLVAARSTWNLRQFDFSPRLRGSLAVRDLLRRFMRPAWKPVRLGLVALLALQVVALNVWAWVHDQTVDDKRRAQVALLAEAHPQVTVVRDPALQMERETDRLRAAAGRPGVADLESMLAAAASAWPDGRGPLQDLRFQVGQLSIGAPGWTPDDVRQFGDRLRPAGWTVSSRDGRITMARAGTR